MVKFHAFYKESMHTKSFEWLCLLKDYIKASKKLLNLHQSNFGKSKPWYE